MIKRIENRPIPNLFVVGCMKSGTSSLHAYLGQHPEIFMSAWKEPQYFSQLSVPMHRRVHKDRDEDWYSSLFQEATDERLIGESSTDYSKLPEFPGVAKRIKSFNPDAKIVYIMRDPIERAISHYWERVGSYLEGRDMMTTVRDEPEIINVGNYAMQIAPYLEEFGRDRVYLLTMEGLQEDVNRALRSLLMWLGADPTFEIRERSIHNAGGGYVDRFVGADLVSRLRQTRLWRPLVDRIPGGIRSGTVRRLTHRIPRSHGQRDEVIDYLRPIVREHVEALKQVTGFDEDWRWTTLNAERSSSR